MQKQELEPIQERAIEMLLIHGSYVRVADELKINRTTLWNWRQQPEFQRAFNEARQNIAEKFRDLMQLTSARAVKCLIDLIESDPLDVPSGVKYAAAAKLLDLRVKMIELESIEALQAEVIELKAMVNPPRRGLKSV
jgi:transposase-like protein